jgi:NitT/TauT family transport system substrate-binding protein
MVERFVRASLRGWEDAVQNPQEAIDALATEFPSVDAENALEQLELTIPLLHTDATEGQPIGCANEADIVNVETILAEAGLIESPTGSAETYFTGQFAPC